MKRNRIKQTITIALSVAMAVTSVNLIPLTAQAETPYMTTMTSSESSTAVLSGKTAEAPEVSYTGKEQDRIACLHFFNISEKARNKVEYSVRKVTAATSGQTADSSATTASYTLEIAQAEATEVKAANSDDGKANKITVSKTELASAKFDWSKYIYFKADDGKWIQDLNASVKAYKGTWVAGKKKYKYAKKEMKDYRSLGNGTYSFKLVIDSENVTLSDDAKTIYVKVKVTANKAQNTTQASAGEEQEAYVDENGKLVLSENVQAGEQYEITATLMQEEATEAQLSQTLNNGEKYIISAGNKTDQYLLDNVVYYQTENGELKEVLDKAGKAYTDPDATITVYKEKSNDDISYEDSESKTSGTANKSEDDHVNDTDTVEFSNGQMTKFASASENGVVEEETEYEDTKISIADLTGGKTYHLKLVIDAPNVKNVSNDKTGENEYVVYVTVFIQRAPISYIEFTPTISE
jgi:hypothetical protein